jgi:hypothetical protein
MLATGSLATTHRGVTRPNLAGALTLTGKIRFISEAEKILIPYKFGVYDILVLPPSFPYGGMCVPSPSLLAPTNPVVGRENACLTFLTPSTSHLAILHESHTLV